VLQGLGLGLGCRLETEVRFPFPAALHTVAPAMSGRSGLKNIN